MSNLQYKSKFNARQIILVALVTTLLALLGLLVFGLYPLQNRYYDLRGEIAVVESRINAFRSLADNKPFEIQVRRAEAANAKMNVEWRELKENVRTFGEDAVLADILASSEEGRIDYKVALYDARQWIGYRARNQNVSVPMDLGMKETIETDEVMESKLWQLAANVSLLEIAIGSNVDSISEIEVLDPVSHSLTAVENVYMLIYPVKLEMVCSYASFLKFFSSLNDDERFYAPQRLLIESVGPKKPEMLRVSVVCSAILFRPNPPGSKISDMILDGPTDVPDYDAFEEDPE